MSGFWDVVGWGSGWFTRYINSNMIFRDNVKLYFGDGKDTSLYWDGSNFYIRPDLGIGLYPGPDLCGYPSPPRRLRQDIPRHGRRCGDLL